MAEYSIIDSLREIHRRLDIMSLGRPLPVKAEVLALGQRIDELERQQGAFHLNSTRSVAVGNERFITDFSGCPRGAKVQLLNPGGVAVYGVYDGDPQWRGWYPIPGAPK